MVRKVGPSLRFPLFTVLKASAGSGKTFALSKRFAGFLLSDEVPRNRPPNLLAITFSNNAAAEMKERVLDRLKRICLGNEEFICELAKDFSEFEGISSSEIRTKAGSTIDAILALYSDFQVKTIDSFMAAVFKASAMDFGYSPDFEIVMSDKSLMKYCLRPVPAKGKGGHEGERLHEVHYRYHARRQGRGCALSLGAGRGDTEQDRGHLREARGI